MSPDEVGSGVAVSVGVTIEASHAEARSIRAAIVDQVELLLGKWGQQQAQPVELLRVQDALEELVEVIRRDQLALRHVAEIRSRGQEDWRRKLGQKVIGKVELEIEAVQITARLAQDLVDVKLREQHAALGLLRVRQREKARGK